MKRKIYLRWTFINQTKYLISQMNKITFTFFTLFLGLTAASQELKYKYDGASRLIEVGYPQQKKVNYTYDKDGNRMLKVESVVISNPNNIQEKNPNATGLIIYPNPTINIINGSFFSKHSSKYKVSVFAENSALVHIYEFESSAGNVTFTFNIQGIASGVYFLELVGDGEKYSGKITVK